MSKQTHLWQEWKVTCELTTDAFYFAWKWFSENGKHHPDYVGDDFIACLVSYRSKGRKARFFRLFRNEFYHNPRTAQPFPAELTIITSDKSEIPGLLKEILGKFDPLSIDISEHIKEPTPRLSADQRRFMDQFIPNRLNPIFHLNGNGEKGWITLSRPLLNVWAVRHFMREPIKIGTMLGDCVGSGPHPGGRWDESLGRWKGGLKVKVANIDIDCDKNDAHVGRAVKLQSFLRSIGVESLLITSSDVRKNGAETPGLRVIFPVEDIWYSEFRAIMTEVLDRAGLDLVKGTCELFPDAARGSRMPFGPGSDVYWNIGGWGGYDLQRVTDDANQGIDMFLKLKRVNLKKLSNKIGIVLTKYGASPWLEPVEQRGAIAGPLTQRMLGAPSEGDGLSVKALLAYGLPGPNTRYAAVGALVGGYRKLGYHKEQIKQKVLIWLLEKHNGHSTLVSEGGEKETRRYVSAAVESLWRRPFERIKSKSRVLGVQLQERPLENSEKEFLRQTVEDTTLRSFLSRLWRGVKELLHAAPGRAIHVSSRLLSECANKRRYSHLLARAESMGLITRVSESYTVGTSERPGVCKSYRFHFQAQLSAWANQAVLAAQKFHKGSISLLSQHAAQNNNNRPIWGTLEGQKGAPFFTAPTPSGVFAQDIEDVVAGIEDWAMSRMMFGSEGPSESPPSDIAKKPTPTHENEEEKARETNIWSGAREFGDFLLRKGVEIHSTPYQEPEPTEPKDIDDEIAAWSQRMLNKASIQENSGDFHDEKSGIYVSFAPKKRKKPPKDDGSRNLSFDFMK